LEINEPDISEIDYRINGNAKPPAIALDYPASIRPRSISSYSIFKQNPKKQLLRARVRVKKKKKEKKAYVTFLIVRFKNRQYPDIFLEKEKRNAAVILRVWSLFNSCRSASFDSFVDSRTFPLNKKGTRITEILDERGRHRRHIEGGGADNGAIWCITHPA